MGKKKSSFAAFFKQRDKVSLFPWPSCKHPRTNSFRVGLYGDNNDPLKAIYSAYFDVGATPESWFTNSSESGSFSTASEEDESGADSLESVMRGVRSDRFFFEEPGDTKSILEEAKGGSSGQPPYEESVVMTLESEDPYMDFRVSMEEMVEAHGLKDWECLEELLQWYLRMNGKKTHGFIVGAFVDLLIRLVLASATLQGGEEDSEINEISLS